MKATKHWLTTIAVLLCSLVASAHDFEAGGIYYNITSSTDLTVAVTYRGNTYDSYSNEYSGAVTIPETVTYNNNTYSVTSIGNSAFRECSSLTAITIPEGVTSIGDLAFYECRSLTSITLPEGVTSIGGWAFYYCSSLTAITLPESVTSIGSYAFSNTVWYNNQVDGVIYAGKVLYKYKGTMPDNTSIEVKEGTKGIAGDAFYGCSSLTSITLSESVTSIGNYAFYNCSSLTSITIPEGVTSIGNGAFRGCSRLTSITIPESVTSIGYDAFYDCSSLTSITIPESVTSIGSSAFYDCSSLTSITIPESVTSIGYDAFYGCSSLTTVSISSIEAWCKISFDGYRSNPLNYAHNLYLNGELVAELVIPESVTSIGNYAFYNCSSLTSITIPESVTSIGNYAFYNCSSLTSITIPEGVTSIGNGAFRGCSRLTSITIPENSQLTSIESYAFYNCSSLTSITIPEGVTSIGNYAFDNCSSLTSITIPEGVTSIGNYAFYNCSSLDKVFNCSNLSLSKGSSNYGYVAYYAKVVYQGGKLTTIGDFQFYTSEGIHSLVNYIGNDTEIVLLDSYNGESYEIGNYAFYGCRSLTSVTIPESVTSIGYDAFEGCNSLEQVTINCANVGDWFSGLSSVKEIVLGEGVTTIESDAFSDCTDLEQVTINCANVGDWFRGLSSVKEVVLGESVTSIGNYAFDNCTSLKKVTFEDGSSTLSLGYNGYSQGLFYDCPLEEVYLGRNLSYSSGSSYGYSPFCYKDALTKVTIGNEVTEIGQYAFYDCDNIHSLTISNGVLSIGSSAFNTPDKAIWLTNTPPTGYANAKGNINYVANNQYTSLSNVEVYPYLSSMFEVDGVRYVPVSPSERTCHAIDCVYGDAAATINVGETASFKGVAMKVTEVMPYTFYGNDHIKEVSVSHLGNLGDYAFYDCDDIKNVDICNQGNIGSQAFYDCDGIKNVDICNQGNIGSQAFYGCNAMETATLANEGTVGNQTFSGCSSLKAVTLGDSIGSLGDKAFYQCSSLQEIVIPDHVKSVGAYCFSGCSAMTNVALGRSITTINSYAFQNCSSLPEITLPQTVTKVDDYVFAGCSKLTDVIIEDRTTALVLGSNGSSALFTDCQLDSVYIGGKITYSTSSSKGYSPFYRNTSLRTVVITDREEQIYANEFYGCTNLQNVTIGNGVKSIGNYAFSGCSSLEGFSFGSNMETIGAEAFSDCTNLTSITSHAAVPPTCGTQALDDINKWECVLGVPLGNADAYYAADQWKEFFFIEDVVEVDHYVLTYVVDGEVVHTEVLKHKDEVTMLAEPTKVGYEFSGWDKTLATMPAEDVIISGTFTRLPIENLVILDTEENFLIDEEMECETVTYTRHFNDTQWQALYVPFEIPVTEEFLANFEVADLNNVHQYDRDDDGVTDETVIEAFKMTSGTLEANYPYLIRAKEAGEKSITVTDAVLYATEENSIDCSSVRDKFTFTGTYSCLSSAELPQGEGYYTLIDGEWKPVTEAVTLGAFRFFLKVDSRSGAAAEARSIRMRIIGENGEDDATGIDNLESTDNDGKTTVIYDLQGRKVLNTEIVQEGVYIINGKKVVIK